MVIAISHSALERHIDILEEEKGQIHLLEESLRQMEAFGAYGGMVDCAAVGECREGVRILERTIDWRMNFLNELNESTRALEKKTKEILEGIETENDR